MIEIGENLAFTIRVICLCLALIAFFRYVIGDRS